LGEGERIDPALRFEIQQQTYHKEAIYLRLWIESWINVKASCLCASTTHLQTQATEEGAELNTLGNRTWTTKHCLGPLVLS
jgi:hypothetical protein